MSKDLQQYVFYDGPLEVGLRELDLIVEGLLCVGKAVLVPTYLRPALGAPEEERQLVTRRLAEFAEEGFLVRWDVENLDHPVVQGADWPAGTERLVLPAEGYGELQERIREGVGKQRDQLAKGLGHAPGEMMSGVAEIVALRSTLWTLGLGRYFDAELLVSTQARERRLIEPLNLLKKVEQVREPVTERLLELEAISGLSLLKVRDIKKLRRKSSGVREFVDAVARDAEDKGPFESAAVGELARELTEEHYRQALQRAARSQRLLGGVTSAASGAITIAGFAVPALGLASFAQPILEWMPTHKPERRLLIFLSGVSRRTGKRRRKVERD
jgi:hypothetical protein